MGAPESDTSATAVIVCLCCRAALLRGHDGAHIKEQRSLDVVLRGIRNVRWSYRMDERRYDW